MIALLRENNKTIILIAHRLSTVLQADKIVVLHDGVVVEEGNHAELISIREQYYELWKQQFPMMGDV
jgi:ATP-binding cassette, subfamily C, bacteriocin exporter